MGGVKTDGAGVKISSRSLSGTCESMARLIARRSGILDLHVSVRQGIGPYGSSGRGAISTGRGGLGHGLAAGPADSMLVVEVRREAWSAMFVMSGLVYQEGR
jgi:hypothetical protein